MHSKLLLCDDAGNATPCEWGKGYEIEQQKWGRRVLCSTDDDRIEFLQRLVERYPGPFAVKYILEDNEGIPDVPKGRYHSERGLTLAQVRFFLHEFGEFLQEDGRHLLMVTCVSTSGTAIYDQHDYFYVYGGLDELLTELKAEGHVEMEYRLGKHGHSFAHDVAPIRRLLRFWPWTWSALEATDTTRERVGWLSYVKMKIKAWRYDRTCRPPD